MASYIATPSGTSARIGPIATDKVRIAATSSLAYAVGDNAVTANTTACPIIPTGVVERSVIVGQGNYVAYINIGSGAPGPMSITELGEPTNN